ncbi:hypothetical protein AB0N60_00040 [Streptomyces microflavus]|uniref:hypothetical protein n=1 Tax=Streptomyces microflavus TaxID=1919 RepID=UPI00343DC54A
MDRYDPARGGAFLPFAMPTVVGEIKRHFRDRMWSVHVPRAAGQRGSPWLSRHVPRRESAR